MSLRMSFDVAGISEKLDKLSEAIKEKAVRPAAQAAAQVFYDEVKLRAPMSSEVHYSKGKKHEFQPGNLKAAIYQAYSPEDSGDGRAAYHVSWNKSKAFYGRFIEFGTVKMKARPFLRPSYDAVSKAAAEAASEKFIQECKGLMNVTRG